MTRQWLQEGRGDDNTTHIQLVQETELMVAC